MPEVDDIAMGTILGNSVVVLVFSVSYIIFDLVNSSFIHSTNGCEYVVVWRLIVRFLFIFYCILIDL